MYRKPRSANDPLWTPTPHQAARFEPSLEDRSAAAAMSAKGLFRPMPRNAECLPHSKGPRSKWGKALSTWTEAGCPVPKQ